MSCGIHGGCSAESLPHVMDLTQNIDCVKHLIKLAKNEHMELYIMFRMEGCPSCIKTIEPFKYVLNEYMQNTRGDNVPVIGVIVEFTTLSQENKDFFTDLTNIRAFPLMWHVYGKDTAKKINSLIGLANEAGIHSWVEKTLVHKGFRSRSV